MKPLVSNPLVHPHFCWSEKGSFCWVELVESMTMISQNQKKGFCCDSSFSSNPLNSHFCLSASAKDQVITWVVLVVVLHNLVHLLFIRNISEKNFSLPGNRTRDLLLPAKHSINWAIASLIQNGWIFLFKLRISKTTLQTLDQYWSTQVSFQNSKKHVGVSPFKKQEDRFKIWRLPLCPSVISLGSIYK